VAGTNAQNPLEREPHIGRPHTRPDAEHRDTPWARVLIEYMQAKRRPGTLSLSGAELANKLGVRRTTVTHWIYMGSVPDIATILAVLQRLDIPMSRLLAEYEKDGLPIPDLTPDSESAPSPRLYTPPLMPPPGEANAWDAIAQEVSASMTEAGLPPSVIQATIQRIRHRQQTDTTTSRDEK